MKSLCEKFCLPMQWFEKDLKMNAFRTKLLSSPCIDIREKSKLYFCSFPGVRKATHRIFYNFRRFSGWLTTIKTGTGPRQFKSAPNLFNTANLTRMGTKHRCQKRIFLLRIIANKTCPSRTVFNMNYQRWLYDLIFWEWGFSILG